MQKREEEDNQRTDVVMKAIRPLREERSEELKL